MGSLPSNRYENICFVDQEHGWVAGKFSQSSIGFTSDGGKTWGFVDQSVSNRNNEVSFSDSSHGWVVGSKGFTSHYHVVQESERGQD